MNNFLEMAYNEAKKGIKAGDGGPFGAVVVKDGKFIAAGHNQVLASHDSTAHAEIIAIRKAKQVLGTHNLSGCELYTTCYPCPMCLGAIMWARIANIYYACSPEQAAAIGFDDQVFYGAIASPERNNIVTLQQLDSREGLLLFEEWLRLDVRKTY